MHPYLDFGIFKLPVFPLFLVTAVFLCILLFLRSAKYDTFFFYNLKRAMIFGVVFAGIGGKGLFALTQIGGQCLTFATLFGGFVFYGGFIGAIIGLAIYCRIYQDRFFDLSDVFVSLLPLGQAIGRLGCYFNGCCYGMEYAGMLSVSYPANGHMTRVFPTWFFESLFCLLLFFAFWRVSKKKKSGFYTSAYMMAYAAFRFVIECFRGDLIRGIWGVFSTSQIISIIVFIGGVAVGIYSHFRMDDNLMFKGRLHV